MSDKIEQPHYALYRQKVLLIDSVRPNRVYFVNPERTHYYYIRGRKYCTQWSVGDTFVIDSNLASFYRLRFVKQ